MSIRGRYQFRRDTASNWSAINPILLDGEMGIETNPPRKYKLGDGITAWNDLPYASSPVVSIFGRSGAITAEFGDYSFDQISGSIDGGSF